MPVTTKTSSDGSNMNRLLNDLMAGVSAPVPREFKVLALDEFLSRDFPRPVDLLSPWLPGAGIAMVFAERGIGKTFFCLEVALSVASGGGFLSWSAPGPAGVLYLDGEMPAGYMQQRLAQIIHRRGIEALDKPFRIVNPDLQNASMPKVDVSLDTNALEDHTEDVDLIIVDNISSLTTAVNENEAESWVACQEWAIRQRARGRTVLFVHHAGKNGSQRGTSKREDVLDTVIQLKHPSDYAPSDGARFEVHFTKARRLSGTELDPVEARLEMDGDRMVDWSHQSKAVCLTEQVAYHLNNGMKLRDIRDELQISLGCVHKHKTRAEEKGLLNG